MDFRLLGPLEVITDKGAAEVGTGKRAALLTYLLINANEVVSSERLIDELWGDRPPATAAKSVQVYVSQLRKALDTDGSALVTRGSGYVLTLADGELDIHRFERFLAEAQRALAAGDPSRGRRAASEALALWRGPALYDVAYEEFAQNEARRLEELRLVALEVRIDADLALGQHAQLAGELEALVDAHPAHERFRAQLMLALYRCGRQSEALDAYRQGSRVLMDEFGLEPSPALRELEGKILSHSDELAAPRTKRLRAPTVPSESAARPGQGRRRLNAAWLLVIGGALVAIAAAAALLEENSSSDRTPAARGDTVVRLDTASGRAKTSVTVGYSPASIAVGAGAVWALNADDQTITRIDPKSGHTDTFGIGATPTDLIVGGGTVWIGAGTAAQNESSAYQDRLFEVDPARRTVRARIDLPGTPARGLAGAPGQLARGSGAIWALGGGTILARVDPRTGRVSTPRHPLRLQAIAADGDSVWAIVRDTTDVVQIDPRTLRLRGRPIHLAAARLDSIESARGAVWVADSVDGTLWRIDPGGKLTTRTIDVGAGGGVVAAGAGAIWVANSVTGTVLRVDPATNRVTKTIPVGGTPRDVTVGLGGVWVADTGSTGSIRTAAPASGQKALPGPACEPIQTAGGGAPDRLIVSDLPFDPIDAPRSRGFSNAIAFVLRRHHFRAGRYRIGYQSCNDATAVAGGWDEAKCVANAKAYAGTRRVLGVIGPLNSGCAIAELPVLNKAPGGPVSMVSMTNDDLGLTRRDPTRPSGALRALYPTGTRNYVRLEPSEIAETAAAVILAERLGLRRVYVLDDASAYGIRNATLFRAAAREAGLPIAGERHWDQGGRGYRALAVRLQRAHTDGVYMGGLSAPAVGSLIRALRERLGPDAPLITPGGMGPLDFVYRLSHGAAAGMYTTLAGPDAALSTAVGHSPAAQAFAHDFRGTQPGVPVGLDRLYTAAATEVLLDAIAHSDGTRRAVARALLQTRLDDSPIGQVAFDKHGDVQPAPVSILRVVPGRVSPIPFERHGELFTVITPPAALLR